jgi:RNA polymerase sigma-32 factor
MTMAIKSLDRQTRSFIAYAMRLPTLTLEEERQLTARIDRDRDQGARERLINAHLKLVVAQALRLRYYGIALGDLIQEGCIGLARALDRFDSARGVRFSTYAAWWVRAAMQEFILRNWSVVRIGGTSVEKRLFFNLRRLQAKLEQTSADRGAAELTATLARRFDVPEAQLVAFGQRLSSRDCSINEPVGNDMQQEVQDLLVDERDGPEALVGEWRDRAERRRQLQAAMTGLSEREKDIIRHRHLSEDPVTLESLGARHGVSKERIRQIESRALKRLRSSIAPG